MCVSVLTHTNPRPPPGDGVAVPVLPITGATEGDELTELLGLKKLPSLNLGDAVGLATGLAVASVCAFSRERLALSDAAADSSVSGGAVVSAGEAFASALFCW